MSIPPGIPVPSVPLPPVSVALASGTAPRDMLAQAYRKPEWAYEMLEYLASMQFEDGHPVHIVAGGRTPAQDITRSDNHLWIVYLAYAIIAESGDMSILDRQIPFLAPDKVHHIGSATLWEHLLRGIDFTEKHMGGTACR